MEVSLTKTLVPTEAGADASGLPLASGDGAIFDALLAASLVQSTSASAEAPMGQVQNVPLPVMPLTAEPAEVDVATQTLAHDLDHMVQALAITADVVVKGMSERAPVREIILKIESPSHDAAPKADLPDLTTLPPQMNETLNIQISTVDLIEKPEAALVVRPATPHASDEAISLQTIMPSMDVVPEEMVPPVMDGPEFIQQQDEMNGPFRVEMHGPFVTVEKALISAPLYVAAVDEPVIIKAPVLVFDAQPMIEQIEEVHHIPPAPQQTDVTFAAPISEEHAEQSIPVLVVKVPVATHHLVRAEHDSMEETSAGTDVMVADAPIHHVMQDQPVSDEAQTILLTGNRDDALQPIVLVAQNMPVVQPQFTRTEQTDKADDLLHAPRAQWQDADFIGPKIPADVMTSKTVVPPNTSGVAALVQPTVKAAIALTPTEDLEVIANEELKSKEAGLPRIMMAIAPKTQLETNVTNSVANTNFKNKRQYS